MKKILFASLIVLVAAACGNNPKKNKSQAPDTLMETAAEEEAASPLAALWDAAPANLTENIARLLPPELVPGPNDEGQDGITQLLNTAGGNSPGHMDWYEFYGECDVEGINTHAFPRMDGSWLVTYVAGAGCDCYVQDEPLAFIYADGKLTPCPWPFEAPKYEDFVNPLVEGLVDPKHLDWIRDDWTVHYNFGTNAPDMMDATLLNIDFYNFTEGCRNIEYDWDGSTFHRKLGRYGLIRNNGFGQFSPYGYVEDIPEGFSVQGKGKRQSLVEDKTGETIATFTIDADDAIMEIEVFSPQYENEYGFYPGEPLSEIDEKWEGWEFQNADAYARLNGDIVIRFIGYNLVVEAKDIEGEPEGAEDKLPSWSYKPNARVKSILIN